MQVNRRGALGLIGAGAVAPSMGVAAAEPARARFRHGVASGDPAATGAILWTRVTPEDPAHSAAIRVSWHVAETAGGRPVESGIAHAQIARDFTVKVEPTNLQGGREYFYHFEVDGVRSPEGRFRTLPTGELDELHLVAVSCQLYAGGLFNVWEMISRRERLDAVIHLGDYIYEYGRDGYGGDIGVKLGRQAEPPHETITLADYRARHAQYRSDPDLQAAHARAAFICVWDDHETANDSWLDGAENHQPQSEGTWAARKAAAMQAYFEWLPIRDPKPGDPWEAINRSFEFGHLATLVMLETRLLARSEPADASGPPTDAASVAAILAGRNRPDRDLMGAPQKQWLRAVLHGSVTAGKPWQIIGNQVVMARVPGPDIEKMMGAEKSTALMAGLAPQIRHMVASAQAGYRAGLPFNLDSWDGYPAARERLYADFHDASCRPLILSGDSHAFWANNLADDHGRPIAVEFGATAISSPSIGDMLDGVPLGQLLEAGAPEVQFCDQTSKGCIFLTLTPTSTTADYVAVSTIFAKEWTEKPVARFRIKPGSSLLERLDTRVPERPATLPPS